MPAPALPRVRVPAAYRQLLAKPQVRLLLAGLGVSSLGDGISTVTIAWLAVGIAPAGALGLFVGLAVAAYTLPGSPGPWRWGASGAVVRRVRSSWSTASCGPAASA